MIVEPVSAKCVRQLCEFVCLPIDVHCLANEKVLTGFGSFYTSSRPTEYTE
jgi:hypothetical protein